MALRSDLIRLAHAKPELRGELLPLLTKQGMEFATKDALESYLKQHPGADRANHSVQSEGQSKVKEDKGSESGGGKKMTVEMKGAAMATSEAVKSEQGKGEDLLRKALGDDKADALIENRKKRDGDKAHITLLSPADTKKVIAEMAEKEGLSKGEAERRVKELVSKGVPEDFTVKGVGKAEKEGKEAYYATVDWPAGDAFRKSLGLPTGDEEGAQHFHITLGFGEGGDVHGVSKKDTSVGKKEASSMDESASLRNKLIRLAHANPELRGELLPLLKEACGYMAEDDEGKMGCGYTADDDAKEAKQMHTVKPEKPKGLTTKLGPQRDPYARSLQQGQFKPKTIQDKRHKDPKYKHQWE